MTTIKEKEGQTTQWSKEKEGQTTQRSKEKEGQTTQWSKEKGQKNKQQSTQNATTKTNDRATQTTRTTWGELRYSGGISISISTSGTRRVTRVTNLAINNE